MAKDTIRRVYECEIDTTATPPFTTTLPDNGTVSLCSITVPSRHNGYLVRAVINWSVRFTPFFQNIILTTPGFAQAQFEILKNGGPIARVTQSLGQLGFTIGNLFNREASNFGVATLQVLDNDNNNINPLSVFEVRATNITLTAPLSIEGTTIIPLGDIISAVGLVSFVVEEVDNHRQEDSDC